MSKESNFRFLLIGVLLIANSLKVIDAVEENKEEPNSDSSPNHLKVTLERDSYVLSERVIVRVSTS